MRSPSSAVSFLTGYSVRLRRSTCSCFLHRYSSILLSSRFLSTVRSESTPFQHASKANQRNDGVLELGKKKKDKKGEDKKVNWSGGSTAMLIIPAFAFSLGCWQVYRLKWKLDLIEHLKSRLSAEAIDFPVDNLSSLDDLEYHRVRISGEFLHEKEFTISPRGRFDPGYKQKDAGSLLSDDNMSSHGAHVITPFKIKGTNLVIMVNRGWVPIHMMSRESRLTNEPRGIVNIEAIVKKSESRPQFMGQNIPEQGIWFYKDFDQMAKQYGTAPIYVEAAYEFSQPGGPIGGQTNINIRNEHLSYLTTWFTLTAVTLLMWVMKFRR